MNYDPHYNPFFSKRNPVYARRGMVATSHPAAADIGLDILKQGGNAVDAAIAAAAALAVLEPTSNGLGSDCFAIIHDGNKLHGLNASGWSPAALSADVLLNAGRKEISPFGWDAVTVPGAMAGWHELTEKFGSLSPAELLQPLVSRFSPGMDGEGGVAVPPTVAANWDRALNAYSKHLPDDPAFRHWFEHFAPRGKAPSAGEAWSSRDQLKTLEILGKEGFRSLYEGSLAKALLDFSSNSGGYLSEDDLGDYRPSWVDPISMSYKGYDIWEIPPNGQGITALMALGMLKDDRFSAHGVPSDMHRGIEAIKLAFSDTTRYVTDPGHMAHSAGNLLDPEYLAGRRSMIGESAGDPAPGTPPRGGTVYLSAADSSGMMVSFIQSNYMGFGSGLVVPGLGIALQNRGHNFTLEEGHPNRLEGRKRPFHTIIPGFLTREGRALGPFGVMGGFMQPQGHLQVVQNLIDYGLNPQAALDAPRWQWMQGRRVMLEPGFGQEGCNALKRLGHDAVLESDSGHFGRGQMILREDGGGFIGATEKRCDGFIASW